MLFRSSPGGLRVRNLRLWERRCVGSHIILSSLLNLIKNMDYLTLRKLELSRDAVIDWFLGPNMLVHYVTIGFACGLLFLFINLFFKEGFENEDVGNKANEPRKGIFWLIVLAWPVIIPVLVGSLFLKFISKF